MSVIESLPITRHQQDDAGYCGAACAQMVLESMGIPLPSLSQDDLLSQAKTNGAPDPPMPWATPPDGLASTMNQNRPASSTETFELASSASEAVISRRICWMIHAHQVAPIALISHAAHWVVVSSYEANAPPKGPNDTTCAIDGFYLYDPEPALPSSFNHSLVPPPPHFVGDGCAATAGLTLEHLTYQDWGQWMTAVLEGRWATQFLAVGVADTAPEPTESSSEKSPPDESSSKKPSPKQTSSKKPSSGNTDRRPVRQRRRSGKRLVTPAEAARLADEGIRAYGLYKRKEWSKALNDSRPSPGRLVHRLDQDDKFYSLVSYRSARGTTVVASVDARAGVYQRAGLLFKPREDPIRVSAEEAMRIIAGQRIKLPDGSGLLVRKGALAMYPHLVWRPCRESLSPFSPFYMFTVGNRRLYVRVDGAVFSSLTRASGC